MKRLTRRYKESCPAFISDIGTIYLGEDEDECWLGEAIEKLASYEDAEEQRKNKLTVDEWIKARYKNALDDMDAPFTRINNLNDLIAFWRWNCSDMLDVDKHVYMSSKSMNAFKDYANYQKEGTKTYKANDDGDIYDYIEKRIKELDEKWTKRQNEGEQARAEMLVALKRVEELLKLCDMRFN